MAIHDLTVARPYAKAAFEFAKSANATEAWGMTLARFAMIAQDSNCLLYTSPSPRDS